MSDVTKYRQIAAELRERADRLPSGSLREQTIALACHFETLAREALREGEGGKEALRERSAAA